VMYIGGEELASGYNKLYKTTDKGVTWDSSITFGYLNNLSSFYFINKDTGWVEVFNGDRTTLYITTNGGLNFTPLSYNTGGPGYYVIYFLMEKYNGNYIGYRSNPEQIEKTTDGGLGWYPLPNLPSEPEDNIHQQYDIRQITFINKDTGWVTNGKAKIFKTTNGGNNWIVQLPPPIPNIIWNGFNSFFIVNKDTIYSDYGTMYFGNNIYKGIIYKTTNGGLNWGYQLPDTSHNREFTWPFFINGLTGWFTNIKTLNGGGPIIYTDIVKLGEKKTTKFELMQNYPNPFNPTTTIRFYLPQRANVYLTIYDINGRKIYTIINNFQLMNGYHSYCIEAFETLGLSSGTYFYRITASDTKSGKTLFTGTKKMLFVK
jgi:photosystem II stability/assembly factor-like uncharacterized protein